MFSSGIQGGPFKKINISMGDFLLHTMLNIVHVHQIRYRVLKNLLHCIFVLRVPKDMIRHWYLSDLLKKKLNRNKKLLSRLILLIVLFLIK